MDLREIGWEGGVEWIQLAQDRDKWRVLVNTVMNLRVLAPRIWLTECMQTVQMICIKAAYFVRQIQATCRAL
jgi:hypothetical protein